MNKKIFTISVISLLIDQVSKFLVGSYIGLGEEVKIFKFFSLTNLNNTGCAFSLLEGKNFLLILFGFFMIFVLIKFLKEFKENNLTYFIFGILYGGIFGNMIDRLFLGYVRDFLKFSFGNKTFPIFNLADSFITVGVIVLLIISFKEGEQNGNKGRNK